MKNLLRLNISSFFFLYTLKLFISQLLEILKIFSKIIIKYILEV